MSAKTRSKALSPQIDITAFKATFLALDRLCKGKISPMCRLLGVSRPIIKRWYHTPPTEWYWPYVIYYAILSNRELHTQASKYRSKHTRTYENILLDMNKQLSVEFKYLVRNGDHIITTDYKQAEKLLITEIIKSPQGYTTPKKLKKKYKHIHSEVFRKAANALGCIKVQQGFGADKESTWTLPSDWGILDYED